MTVAMKKHVGSDVSHVSHESDEELPVTLVTLLMTPVTLI
jgi:hypothetical protein